MWANSPQFVRQKLFERDRGVCSGCGVDTERMRRRASVVTIWDWHARYSGHARIERFRARNGWNAPVPRFLLTSPRGWHAPNVQRAVGLRIASLRAAGWPVGRRMSWWEADHIVPVVEGGGQCGAENYRTLCCRCHGSETAQLRKRLAEAKRNRKEANAG
mgnify:FL=1